MYSHAAQSGKSTSFICMNTCRFHKDERCNSQFLTYILVDFFLKTIRTLNVLGVKIILWWKSTVRFSIEITTICFSRWVVEVFLARHNVHVSMFLFRLLLTVFNFSFRIALSSFTKDNYEL